MSDTNKTQGEQDQPEITKEAPTEEQTKAIVEREPLYAMDEDQMMEHTIEVAEKLAKYEKALDMVISFIIKRCYVGDFVSHDSVKKPLEERTANINNAAAERIARDLGIRESNRSNLKKEIDKDGHYSYSCTGDFSFRGQTVSAMGQATTKSPFYSKRHGKDRPINEIREDYVRTECIRDLTKQGIRKIFGLRRIPLTKLKELGYDITKVRVVNFDEKEGSQAAKNPGATKIPPKWVILTSCEERKYGTKEFVVFKTKDDGDLSCWHRGEVLKQLKDSVGKAQIKVELIRQSNYLNIDKILEVGAL